MPIRNVLLISIDTCRPDYLSCYGFEHSTTPHIDRVAAAGTLFERAISPVPLTLPAHSTMLTGTLPPFHGVHDNHDYRLSQAQVSLAELLQSKGWDTGAVVGTYVLDSQFGLDQGFDFYQDQFDTTVNPEALVKIQDRRGEEVSRYATQWLNDHQNNPFFLFLHFYDPHQIYDPPEPFRSRFADSANSAYVGEISYTDYCVGKVLEKLKSLQLYESTLILITSDHGEMLGDHQELTHGYYIYQPALRVPLIIKLPGQKEPQRVRTMVGLVDIMPTVCDLLDIEVPTGVNGESLAPCLVQGTRDVGNRFFYCESLIPTKWSANHLLGLVTDDWKYIETTRPELYHLDTDPQEQTNLVDQQPQQARQLRERLQSILQEQVQSRAPDSHIVVGTRGQRALESLGYVSGHISEHFDLNNLSENEDPKDVLDFYKVDMGMFQLIYEKQYDLVRKRCRWMIKQRPDFPAPYRYLARIATEQNQTSDALLHWEKSLELDPNHKESHMEVALLFQNQGNAEAAEHHYREALRIQPGFVEAEHNLGLLFFHTGQLDKAVRHLEQALRSDPEMVQTHHNLGCVLASQWKLEEALVHFQNALRLEPGNVQLHYDMAQPLQRLGHLDEAMHHYQEILRLDPHFGQVRPQLGNLLLAQKKFAEAENHFRLALKTNSDNSHLHDRLGITLVSQRKLQEAVTHFRRSLQLAPNDLQVSNRLANTLEKLEQVNRSQQPLSNQKSPPSTVLEPQEP